LGEKEMETKEINPEGDDPFVTYGIDVGMLGSPSN